MLRKLVIAGLGLCLSWSVAAQTDPFPRPPELEPAVSFWRDVFVKYSEHQLVLHDRANTHIVYRVIDFQDVVPLLDAEELWLHKRKVEAEQKDLLREQLLQLADGAPGAVLSPELRTLRGLLDRHGLRDPVRIREAAENLRGQRGLREKTEAALMRSGRYLPYMERVFEEAGLPVLLTRLPLVESSFNNAAYSKSGAAGVWQFMPGTARIYMSYDEIGDERRDPWRSTEAAAAHLSDDYALLQDWPLAVTAYNYGRNGIARALAEIDGNSLVDMIQRYEHPRWGFAGKNFYAEFLAAIDVEQNALKYFGPIRRDAEDEFDEIRTEHYVRYDTLQRLAQDSPERFAELNPSFSTAVQQGHLYVPPGKRIRVPRGHAPRFRRAYASLGAGELFASQRDYFIPHRVRSGETLSGIARQYRTSIRSIREANGLRDKHFIRIGQTLKVPTNGAGAPARPAVHVVRAGETLGAIAERYGVSVKTLQRQNEIDEPDLVRAGEKLTVRARPSSALAWHTVRPGETLSGIARRYGVSLSRLQRDNSISRPENLRAGARLKIAGATRSGPSFHVIRSGQTLESIARQYGLSVEAIASANSLADANRVRAGQRLRLPES